MRSSATYINKFICIWIFFTLSQKADANSSQNKTKRPNILWITCEDMSANLPMYGDSTIKTPNLSRLAKEGVI